MTILRAYRDLAPRSEAHAWRSPSNIALVKYWGKKGHQLPANPSLSMTLKECFTETRVNFSPAEELRVQVRLDGDLNEKFAAKILKFLRHLSRDLPWLEKLSFEVETRNTFPHGTGIASSASGMSALALCLASYLEPTQNLEFFQRASFLARLASGSACRSLYGGFVSWGDVSDEFASPVEVHRDLSQLHDSIVVVSSAEKKVSSTAGHEQMGEHFFREARYHQARGNYSRLKSALLQGDIAEVGRITESEALSLHAMMLTAPESFTLLRPQSLMVMELVREFRRETKLPLYFTLDAGPNLHLIYPDEGLSKIRTFIEHELTPMAEKIIHDQRGEGPAPC